MAELEHNTTAESTIFETIEDLLRRRGAAGLESERNPG